MTVEDPVAFLLLINERLGPDDARDWETFAAQHPELLQWKPSLLDCYYTRERLWSDQARRSFVMPDRVVAAAAGRHESVA